MNHSIFDSLPLKNYSISPRSVCLHCSRRHDCPYSCDRAYTGTLRDAADQGHASAQLLAAEANRFLEAISAAADSNRLLHADKRQERTLANMLHEEITIMQRLYASS